MKEFNLITIESVSKYGQNYIEANTSIFENTEMTTRLIKTSEIDDIFLISDYDLDNHKENEVDWVKSMIKENLHKFFYLKVNKTYPCFGNSYKSNLLLVKGNYSNFIKMIHTGGNFIS